MYRFYFFKFNILLANLSCFKMSYKNIQLLYYRCVEAKNKCFSKLKICLHYIHDIQFLIVLVECYFQYSFRIDAVKISNKSCVYKSELDTELKLCSPLTVLQLVVTRVNNYSCVASFGG